jgi:hypothetical protein
LSLDSTFEKTAFLRAIVSFSSGAVADGGSTTLAGGVEASLFAFPSTGEYGCQNDSQSWKIPQGSVT